jgi:hypothetical protein
MILDERTEFADALAMNTGGVATYNVGDVIDTQGQAIGQANLTRDLGLTEIWLVIRVAVVAAGASAVGQWRLVSDDTATPSTTTATVHYTSAAIPMATLAAGYTIAVVKLPSGAYERYLGIQQITSGAAFSSGSIDAFLTSDPNLWRAYADNVN